MMQLQGSIVRNINTPNVGVYILKIESDGINLSGKVRYFPMDQVNKTFEEAVDCFVSDNHFLFEEQRFYKEFEILSNPGEIDNFKDADWRPMRGVK